MSEISLLTYLMDDAFDGRGLEESNESQALMTNLAGVSEAMWRARTDGSARTIEAIVLHLGGCKVMYADYAFGPGRLTWERPEVEPWPVGTAPMTEALAWLRETHVRLMSHIAALQDDDLARPRLANWGEQRETRWLLAALLEHDTYHAGEINHIRSILHGDDRWRWQQVTGVSE